MDTKSSACSFLKLKPVADWCIVYIGNTEQVKEARNQFKGGNGHGDERNSNDDGDSTSGRARCAVVILFLSQIPLFPLHLSLM